MLHLWDDEAGYLCRKFRNFGFVKSEFGKYKTLHGEKVDKVYDFKWDNPNVYEADLPVETKILMELYRDTDEPAKNIKTLIIDIETDSSGGFPDMKTFDKEITAFSYYDKTANQYKCLILDKESKVQPYVKDNIEVLAYDNEESLLKGILQTFEQIRPDIVTGWNICYNGDSNGFDIPYIYGRICKILGASEANRLSEIGQCYNKKRDDSVVIAGVNTIDYLLLYKKFRFEPRQNYRLGYIGQLEVGKDKIKYEGSLNQLYKEDINKFIEYNLCDVEIVKMLDDQFKFLDLAVSVTTTGHVPFEWFHMSSRFIEGAVITYMRRNGNMVAPNKPVKLEDDIDEEANKRYEEMMMDNTEKDDDDADEGFTGAYVKNPIPGLYSWVFSADINSLYPSTIRTLNISPETYIGRISNWDNIEFTKGTLKEVKIADEIYPIDKFKQFIEDEKINISSIGAMYKGDKMGIIPTILEMWFKQRIEYQELMKQHAKNGEKEKEDYYSRRQHVQKIFLNCFSPDTNVVTPTGIKSITNFKVGDLVYSLNRTTGKTEIKPVTRVYEYDYEGDMVHFNSAHCDFITTPNHKFWVAKLKNNKYQNFDWEFSGNIISDKKRRKFPKIDTFPETKKVSKIYLMDYAKRFGMDYVIKNNKIRIKRQNDSNQQRHTCFVPNEYDINDWLEFIGWYVSEGSLYTTTSKKYKTCSRGISYGITLSQQNYRDEIRNLLNKMQIPFSENEKEFKISNDIIYKILETECGKYSENKKIPSWVFGLNKEHLKHLYKTLMLGDGHKTQERYTTKSVQLKNDFIHLCFNIGDVYAFLQSSDGCYRIQINKVRGKNPVLKSEHRKLIPYKGKVYCVEVEDNHTLLCGRNDKYQWCGQSVYGILGLPTSRLYLKDNAESTTLTGQTIIKTSEKIVIDYFKKKYAQYGKNLEDIKNIVQYIDTDSIYSSVNELGKLEGIKEENMKEYTKKICQEIVDILNATYPIMVKRLFNSDFNKIKIAPDTISATAFWKKKKAYALNQTYDMGKGKDVNKIKVVGLSSVRSDFPIKFKEFYEKFLKDILYRAGAEKISDSVLDLKTLLKSCTIYELAKNTGVKFASEKKGINFNPKNRNRFYVEKGATAQCKAALMYNDLLIKFGVQHTVEPIYSGQKIKYVYLKNNEYGLEALAFKGDGTDPKEIMEFINIYCDKTKMYESVLENKVEDFFNILKWKMPTHEAKKMVEFFNAENKIENYETLVKTKKIATEVEDTSELFDIRIKPKTPTKKIKEKKPMMTINKTHKLF
jgi:DNA polymerase I